MVEIEVDVDVPDRAGKAMDALVEIVERAAADGGLRIAVRGTLKTYPGSIHWHFKRPNEPGTLEATLDPGHRRLWLKIQSGRAAPWTTGTARALKQVIERETRRCSSRG